MHCQPSMRMRECVHIYTQAEEEGEREMMQYRGRAIETRE